MYFRSNGPLFRLRQFGEVPLREAQLGALHAVAAHFTVSSQPALVAMPTGVGKTAVANALPFLFGDLDRVLVVEPSVVLRRQTAQEFDSLDRLKALHLLPAEVPPPHVLDLDRRPSQWSDLAEYDVVVAHPASLHAEDFAEGPTFPPGFFDLVVFDEAHHIAAPTWRAILEHLPEARQVLLTATPFRRDRRKLAGELVYDYPLSRAVDARAYHPVEVVPVPSAGIADEAERDRAIRQRVLERLGASEHENSGLLVRARSKVRAQALVDLYSQVGVELVLVHSGLTPATVSRRLDQVQAGDVCGAAFVGVLGEGFDCPRLKIGAYHDKHKSLPATLQFLGRLSRTTDQSVGPAEVVTTYEDLRADTWELYRHDAVWQEIIPRLVEDAGREARTRGQMFSRLPEIGIGDLSLHDIMVRRQTVVFEVDDAPDTWEPDFSDESRGPDVGA